MMITEPLAFESRPSLRSPVLLLAFSGWSDAGASATTAVRYLVDQLLAKKFASIDPEDFYDFSTQRPVVRLTESKLAKSTGRPMIFIMVRGWASKRILSSVLAPSRSCTGELSLKQCSDS